jgi:hypothetical protein
MAVSVLQIDVSRLCQNGEGSGAHLVRRPLFVFDLNLGHHKCAIGLTGASALAVGRVAERHPGVRRHRCVHCAPHSVSQPLHAPAAKSRQRTMRGHSHRSSGARTCACRPPRAVRVLHATMQSCGRTRPGAARRNRRPQWQCEASPPPRHQGVGGSRSPPTAKCKESRGKLRLIDSAKIQ